MNTSLLDAISQPSDLKKLTIKDLKPLCEEIRTFLLENVSKTGGHLASNLGVIELTVALHHALTSPVDQFVFDVGHQCYTHKILTGRRNLFSTLRKLDGLSGFPKPTESEHDTFVAGHGNTSISVAIGIARAKKLNGEQGKVVAIIGDGAFTGGMVYEGLNNIDVLDNLVVILNDNNMSISKNVGAMARYLTQLRTAPRYFHAKEKVAVVLDSIPLIGTSIKKCLQFLKMRFRRWVYQSTWFENLGFQYIGPIDGHDVARLTHLFSNLRYQNAPIFIHMVTKKGKGYLPAEENPGEFHGVSSFDPSIIIDPDVAQQESFSTAFGKKLVELGKENEKICAITAAMKYGTGLQFFHRDIPDRFFDVGMAEQHAVTFAAGLACKGMLPVVAIYSTFLQRSFDQIIHDVKLMNLNVLFAIDRAGLVPGDGETHQGIFDPAYLRTAGVRTISPSNYQELEYWLQSLLSKPNGPAALRYPRGGACNVLTQLGCTGALYDLVSLPKNNNDATLNQNRPIAIVSYGSEMEDAYTAANLLESEGYSVACYKLLQISPIPEAFVTDIIEFQNILFAEECVTSGSIGESLQIALLKQGWHGTFKHVAVETIHIPHAQVSQIKTCVGLDATHLVNIAKEILH